MRNTPTSDPALPVKKHDKLLRPMYVFASRRRHAIQSFIEKEKKEEIFVVYIRLLSDRWKESFNYILDIEMIYMNLFLRRVL